MPRGLDGSPGQSDINGTSLFKYDRNRYFGLVLRNQHIVAKAELITKMCTLLPIVPTKAFVTMRSGKPNAYNK